MPIIVPSLQQAASLKRPSAADIIGRRSQPNTSPPALPVAPATATGGPRPLLPQSGASLTAASPPHSPPLEVTSPVVTHKQALLPSTASNSVFEHFKRQALEKNERVSGSSGRGGRVSSLCCCRIDWPSSKKTRERNNGGRLGWRLRGREKNSRVPPPSRPRHPQLHRLPLAVWRTQRASRSRESGRERSSGERERL